MPSSQTNRWKLMKDWSGFAWNTGDHSIVEFHRWLIEITTHRQTIWEIIFTNHVGLECQSIGISIRTISSTSFLFHLLQSWLKQTIWEIIFTNHVGLECYSIFAPIDWHLDPNYIIDLFFIPLVAVLVEPNPKKQPRAKVCLFIIVVTYNKG